jgi:hypothetical protein
MKQLDVIDVGPAMNEWLHSWVRGHEWRLGRARRNQYDLVIFDNNGQGIYHDVKTFDNEQAAMNWARDTFVTEMARRGHLPGMGLRLD